MISMHLCLGIRKTTINTIYNRNNITIRHRGIGQNVWIIWIWMKRTGGGRKRTGRGRNRDRGGRGRGRGGRRRRDRGKRRRDREEKRRRDKERSNYSSRDRDNRNTMSSNRES